jgi:NADH-quinone oxidoreductase subunit N
MPFGTLGWASPMVVIAGITITVGNVAAVRQDNVKRMLAYSSISHGGVLLVGLSGDGPGCGTGDSAIVYYLIAYSVTTMGVRGGGLRRQPGPRAPAHRRLGRAGRAAPGAALAMTVCAAVARRHAADRRLLRQVLPLQVGDGRCTTASCIWLVVVGVANSAISIYYYLRIVTAMYFRERDRAVRAPTRAPGLIVVMAAGVLLILHMGVMPAMWSALGH